MPTVERWVPILQTTEGGTPAYRPDLPGPVIPHGIDMHRLFRDANDLMPENRRGMWARGEADVTLAILKALPNQTALDPATVWADIEAEIVRCTIEVAPDGMPVDRVNGGIFVSECLCLIDDAWLPRVTAHVAAKGGTVKKFADGTERDRLMVGMMRHRQDRGAFFDTIPDVPAATPERKRMVKDVLLQAVARGLEPTKAEAIRARLNLPLEAADRGR